jgi:N-acetylmuramoyl-L-alanine amidase
MPTFTPDSSVVSDVIPSPNFGERNKGLVPDMIVLHYTGMPDPEGAIARLCSAGTDVSAHYIVLEDGRIVQTVPEAKRAWHAGVGFWAGEEDINSCSIGIEIINRGHDWGYPDFPSRQIAAVTALCRGIMLRHDLQPHRVLGHSDVSPSRKKDPGEKFPWHSLANSGVGHWVMPAPIVRGEAMNSALQATTYWRCSMHWRAMATASRPMASTMLRPWKWSPPSSAISVPSASTVSWITRR